MNTLLWVSQVLAALMYASSGIMKIFMFDSISQKVPSFGAMPRQVWLCLGILELICVAGLILPSALRWHPMLTVLAAALLAAESLVFIWVHVKYAETSSILMSAFLGLLMLFIAYGRLSIKVHRVKIATSDLRLRQERFSLPTLLSHASYGPNKKLELPLS